MPKEVANFLEQDRKREQAKQDQRHLNKSEFETVLSGLCYVRRPVEDAALQNLQLETLRTAVDSLLGRILSDSNMAENRPWKRSARSTVCPRWRYQSG